MKKFFAAILFIAAAAILIYGVKYAITPVNTQTLHYITQENSINTNGFIVREEWVMTSRSAGTAYYSVSEGDRVPKDSALGEFFYGDVSASSLKELAVIDNKIKTAKNEMNISSTAVGDEGNVENNIFRRETAIIGAAASNDVSAVARYKREINSLRANNSISPDDTVTELEAEKERVLSEINLNHDGLWAQISGVFTTYIDGYEDILKPEDIEYYDVPYFKSLSQSPKTWKLDSRIDAGGAVCKIANNHVWYVMADVPADIMNGRGKGDSVKLRFNNMAGAMTEGEIYCVSGEQDGRLVLTIKCPRYLENAFSYRLADVDVIFESYRGYKIPVQAIRTEEGGRQKVIGLIGNTPYDCYCDVLFTNADGGYMIVDSAENAENKLSQMERIMVGER